MKEIRSFLCGVGFGMMLNDEERRSEMIESMVTKQEVTFYGKVNTTISYLQASAVPQERNSM